MRVAALTVFLLGRAAVAGITPEARLDPSTVRGPLPGEQLDTVLARFDGGTFAAWTDFRTSDSWPDVFAARVPDSSAFVPTPFRVAGGPGAQAEPSVGCGFATCVVAWSEGQRIFARRYDLLGQPLDATPLAVSDVMPDYSNSPTVAWSGGAYRILWTGTGTWSRALAEDGTLGAPDLPLGTGFSCDWPKYVAGPAGALLFYDGATGAAYSFALPDGGFAAPVTVDPSLYYAGNTAAAGADGLLVTWVANAPFGLFAARVDDAGVDLDPTPLSLGSSGGPPIAVAPVVGGYLTAWTDFGDIHGAAVSAADGAVTPLLWDSRPGNAGYCALASSDDGLVTTLAYSQGNWGSPAKLSIRPVFGRDAGVELVPASGPNAQYAPFAVHGDGGFLAAWEDERFDSGTDIRVVLLDERGVPAGPPHDIAATPASERTPVVAWTGSEYVLAWRENSDVQFSLLALVLDGAGNPVGAPVSLYSDISPLAESPAIAAGPKGVIVAFSTWEMPGYEILTALVADGGVSAAQVVTPGVGGRMTPALAWSGGLFALATADVNAQDVEVRFLDDQGGLLGSAPIVTLPSTGGELGGVGIASDGANFLVVWTSKGSGRYSVYAQRVSSAGAVLDSAPLHVFDATGAYPGQDDTDGTPSVSWDGLHFLVGFGRFSPTSGSDIVFKRVTASGVVAGVFTLAANGDDDTAAVLAPGSTGRTLFLYRTFDTTLDVPRAADRVFTEVPVGSFCVDASECLSGVCVAGVCCQSDGGCGAPDGGGDAGQADGGTDGGSDAGSPDGGSPGNAGPTARRYRLGCDCSSGSGAPLVLALLLLARRLFRRG